MWGGYGIEQFAACTAANPNRRQTYILTVTQLGNGSQGKLAAFIRTKLTRGDALYRRSPLAGGSKRACISVWWKGIGGLTIPEWRAGRRRPPEDAWQTHGAANADAN